MTPALRHLTVLSRPGPTVPCPRRVSQPVLTEHSIFAARLLDCLTRPQAEGSLSAEPDAEAGVLSQAEAVTARSADLTDDETSNWQFQFLARSSFAQFLNEYEECAVFKMLPWLMEQRNLPPTYAGTRL
jgi:hypothetical protein